MKNRECLEFSAMIWILPLLLVVQQVSAEECNISVLNKKSPIPGRCTAYTQCRWKGVGDYELDEIECPPNKIFDDKKGFCVREDNDDVDKSRCSEEEASSPPPPPKKSKLNKIKPIPSIPKIDEVKIEKPNRKNKKEEQDSPPSAEVIKSRKSPKRNIRSGKSQDEEIPEKRSQLAPKKPDESVESSIPDMPSILDGPGSSPPPPVPITTTIKPPTTTTKPIRKDAFYNPFQFGSPPTFNFKSAPDLKEPEIFQKFGGDVLPPRPKPQDELDRAKPPPLFARRELWHEPFVKLYERMETLKARYNIGT